MRKFIGQGIPLWEQQTLYAKSSALQFLNVRVLCNVIKRSVYQFLIYGLQEPGDDILSRQLKFGLEDYLRTVQNARGIKSFRVIITPTNNPPALVNSGILNIGVYIVPILAVHEIQLTLMIGKDSLEISETELAALA
jgi:phage tail sheath protein FI